MLRKVLTSLLALGAVCFVSTGCVNSHRTPDTVVVVPKDRVFVTEAPPEPRVEVAGTSPGSDHVWIPGYWARPSQRWMWVPGHWEVRPKAGASWTPGRWERDVDGKGWVWIPGTWN